MTLQIKFLVAVMFFFSLFIRDKTEKLKVLSREEQKEISDTVEHRKVRRNYKSNEGSRRERGLKIVYGKEKRNEETDVH